MSDLPKSVWSGSFMLGNVEVKCHVLDTGERVIEAESMERIFSPDADFTESEALDWATWVRGTTQ